MYTLSKNITSKDNNFNMSQIYNEISAFENLTDGLYYTTYCSQHCGSSRFAIISVYGHRKKHILCSSLCRERQPLALFTP